MVFKFLIPFHELHVLCLNLGLMVFTCENHLQLAHIFFLTTLFFFHDVVWEIQEVRNIQQRVFKFLIPFHELHELCLNSGVMVFTCENQLKLARNFFFTTLFFFHDVVSVIPEVRKIQERVFKNSNSLLWVAWVVVELGGHGFHTWKPCATCTYFFFHYFIFFHERVWEIPEVRKIQQRIFKFLIPFHELHELCWTRGSWFSHLKAICNLQVFFFHEFIFFLRCSMGNTGDP